MRIYLDMCCYNRLYDENFSEETLTESKSVMKIQMEILKKNLELVTSFMLHYENYRKKDIKQRDKVDMFIKSHRKIYVGIDSSEELKIFADKFVSHGLKIKDAYHLSSAIFAGCDYFITVDKRLLKYFCNEIKITNPIDFIKILEV